MSVYCSKCSLKYVVVDFICVKIFTFEEWKWTITQWHNICMGRNSYYLFIPKNLVSFVNCAQYPSLKECPVCRKTIQKCLKSYMFYKKKWIYIVQ